MNVPVAIVGMACMFPKAPDLRGYWRVLRLGVDCISDVPSSHWSPGDYFDADPRRADFTYARRGGFIEPVDFDPTEFQMPPAALEATDTSQILGLVAAKAALEDAGYGADRVFERERTSVILGVTGCLELVIPLGARLGHPHWRRALQEAGVADEVAEDVMRRIADAYVPWQENSFPGLLGNVVAGRIANRLNLRGTNCVVDAACASSHSAAHLATLELGAGRSDMVVTGGVDTFNDIFMYMCFSKTPALSPSGEIRPFSEDADGTLLGEGIGMVVLKRLEDAERDGDRVYAVIRGVGTSSDGEGQAIYAPHAPGQKRALQDAYRVAGVRPATVGLVEAHGTGTKVGDVVEMEALREVFEEDGAAPGTVAVGSVKSQIGHTKAAAGSAGLIKAALALHHKVLPPTLKVTRPNPRLAVDDSPFYLNVEARPWVRGQHPRRASLSSFGFGGSNYHMVLEEHGARRMTPAWDGSVEIFAFSGAHRGALLTAVRGVSLDGTPGDLARQAAASRARFAAADPARLVVVGEDLAAVATALAEGRPLPAGAYLGEGPVAGEVAFLFSGQGSQYVGMGRELACVFPEMLDALEALDEALGFPLSQVIHPPHAFDEGKRQQQDAELTRTENAQPALGAVEVGMLGVLSRFGLRPAMVGGHSYGELVALHAADGFAMDDLLRMSRLRGQLMAGDGGDRGTMLAVAADVVTVRAVLVRSGLDVTVANHNSPTQVILSGTREAIEKSASVFAEEGVSVRPLRVAAAFHSPLVSAAREPFREALSSVALGARTLPVYANVTAQPYPSADDEARDLLADQLVCSVDFVGQVERMYQAGARVFVEVGPRGVLTGLVRAILGDRPHEAIALDASSGRTGLVDLARAMARGAALGLPVALERWEGPPPAEVKRRMTVQLVGANYRSPRPALPPRPRSAAGGNGAASHVGGNGKVGSSRGNGTATPIAYRNGSHAAAAPAPVATSAPRNGASPAPATEIRFGVNAMSDQASSQAPGGAPPEVLREAFQSVHGTLAAMQALQQQTAQAHQRFLEGQEIAQRTLQQMVEGQQRLVERMLGMPTSAPAPQAYLAPQLPPATPAVPQRQGNPATAAPPPAHQVPALAVAPLPVPAPAAPATDISDTLLTLVAEKTGYPREMLHLDMDLEADLGIDSIKRVEILAAVEERVPNAARIESDRVGSLRTLREVAAAVGAAPAPVAASAPVVPAAAPSGVPTEAAPILLQVVADKTGYPVDMLNLDMDLESDLGIDSIKRVEILAAMEERLGGVRIESDRVGSLRTLRSVVDALSGPSSAAASPAAAPPQPAPLPPPPEPAALPGPLTRRVLRAIESPRPLSTPIDFPEGTEIRVTDDGTGLSAAIVDDLSAEGKRARLVSWDEAASPGPVPVSGIVLVTPPAPPTDEAARAAETRLKSAFRIVSNLAGDLTASASRSGALVATVTRMDGAFGLEGDDFDPTQGGLAGLPRTAAQEWTGVRARAIDVAATWQSPYAAAETVVRELWTGGPLEVGLDGTSRRVLRIEPSPLTTGPLPFAEGDVVVVTGGARGVTAEVAVALAEAGRPAVALLGRSSAPVPEPAWLAGLTAEADLKRAILENELTERPSPADLERAYRERMASREIAATLRRLEVLGVRATYRAVDVRDAAAVDAALDAVRAELGPIRGLVHGAGVLADRRIQDKTDVQFDAVFDTKVRGLRNLLQATAGDDLKCLVLFSSVTSRYGRPGQVDYCMANEVMNKIAWQEAGRRPTCRVASIDWGPWDGGMVNDGLRREFARIGVGLIPLQDGARALIAELRDTAREPEVLIGDGFPEAEEPVSAPAVEITLRLSTDTHPFLSSHVLAGRPVLPLAMSVEWMAHAALHANPGLRFVGIDELDVARPVALDGAGTLTLVASPARAQDGDVEVDVELRLDGVRCVTGRVLLSDALPESPELSPSASLSERAPSQDLDAVYGRLLFHGPHLHALRAVRGWSPQGIVADLATAPSPGEWMADPPRSEWIGDPLALDGGLQLALLWCFESRGVPSLPTGGARYRQFVSRFPRQGVTAWVEARGEGSRRYVADIVLADAEGRVLARCEGFEFAADASLEPAFGRVPAAAST